MQSQLALATGLLHLLGSHAATDRPLFASLSCHPLPPRRSTKYGSIVNPAPKRRATEPSPVRPVRLADAAEPLQFINAAERHLTLADGDSRIALLRSPRVIAPGRGVWTVSARFGTMYTANTIS